MNIGMRVRWKSKRQKAYAVYLRSEHWSELRQEALDRDVECVRCGSEDNLQVHHLLYRGRPEDSLLEDLETLCKKCHQTAHGYAPSEFDLAVRKIKRTMVMEQADTVDDWKAVKRNLPAWQVEYIEICDFELEQFAELMFDYVLFIVPQKVDGVRSSATGERAEFWMKRARAVKFSILGRSPTWVEFSKQTEERRLERVR